MFIYELAELFPLICSLNQLLLPHFSSLPPRSRGVLVVYGRRWRTAGARPVQNTTKVIQFGVGSKLFGHLLTAWHGDEHRTGSMHISV